jgi:small-conductance mechanosensitive channel
LGDENARLQYSKPIASVAVILGRRPYGIGDRISVSGVETNTSLDGALPWTVEHVTLFETVLTHLPTNERASVANGSLANSRIINWARSPQAQFHIFLNFPLDTPYEKLVIFKRAIEEYMKARPREWRALNGFRANRIYADQNYMEFIIVIQ